MTSSETLGPPASTNGRCTGSWRAETLAEMPPWRSPAPVRDAVVTLSDGRRLAFTEWGVPDGRPVIWHPGTPGSRLSCPRPELAAAHGLRLIVVERPGFGRSDAQPGRTVLAWPRDLASLADHLGLARF